ncbi:MAG: hypothetical protein H6766_01455 [Candidatus Peribacteria bacterium]|nr:MAG: hypothetical protein H6766_01455 [Candidatus Peribacteria bacterium]
MVDIDTGDGSLSFINNPTITFSATDNIAVDYFEILYTDIAGTPSTLVYTGSS